MTIKFVCSCGKHLKARDDMAARRSVCPRCGSPVGIPSLTPNHPGAAAPMTPVERARHARNSGPTSESLAIQAERPAGAEPPVIDTGVVRLLSNRGQRPPGLTGRHLEKHWYQCLLYPFRTYTLCLSVAVFLTALTAGVAGVLLHFLIALPTESWALAAYYLTWLLLVVFIAGLPCSFLECVLASAAAGEIYYIRWSGRPTLTILFSGAKWLTCFLAGPSLFAVVGTAYWENCGDPSLVDYLILVELGVAGFAYWILALLALTDRGRLRDLNPLAVADLAYRLGWRALVVLAAALLFLGHGWVLVNGLEGVQAGTLTGWVMLAGGWISAVFWGTFFCRLLGVWCYRTRPADSAPAPE